MNVFPALLNGREVNRETPMLWWLYHARGAKEVSMRMGDHKMLANMLPQSEITIRDASAPQGVGIMDFIKQSDLGNFTLYDLKNDPSETTNLAESHRKKFESMRLRMIQLHSEIREEGPRYELGSNRKRK